MNRDILDDVFNELKEINTMLIEKDDLFTIIGLVYK